MTRDEHAAAIRTLMGFVAAEHQAAASEALTALSDDYAQTLSTLDAANKDVERLTANNETLRDVNSRLFLRVGEIPKREEPKPTDTADDDTPLPFTELFNEKGELI